MSGGKRVCVACHAVSLMRHEANPIYNYDYGHLSRDEITAGNVIVVGAPNVGGAYVSSAPILQ